MSRLIAEIGGSSSRWALLGSDAQASVHPIQGESMPGFNPLSGDAERFALGIRSYFMQRQPAALEAGNLVVYGAGCGSPERAAVMEAALRQLWPAASIAVRTDLEGAARGLWGEASGLVVVLGTGSSVGWFDGERLHQRFPSLGYVLGDEGSGADIGRALLQDAFYRRMPDDLRIRLYGEHGPSLHAVLEEVYRSPFPSRALAAHAGKLAPFMLEDYPRELVTARFEAFIEAFKPFFTIEQRERARATGSVAWGFREILADRLLDHGMELQAVERDPLTGLVEWHRRRQG